VSDVSQFEGSVYGFDDGDEVVGNGRLLNKLTKTHTIKCRVSVYN
jgi:hypothetical protein